MSIRKLAFTAFTAFTAALVLSSRAMAQDPLSAAKKKAQDAKAAADAHTAAMQKPEATAPTAKAPAQAAPKTPPQQAPKTPAQAAPKVDSKTAAKADTKLPQKTAKPGSQMTVATTDTAGPPPTIYREMFEYQRDGRRDPFLSLLLTTELRPTLGDLRLTGILYDHAGQNSVATLRDATTGIQYRVSVGSTLGRMRVTAIRVMTIVFTIDEFGTTRRDSITLRDPTKARTR